MTSARARNRRRKRLGKGGGGKAIPKGVKKKESRGVDRGMARGDQQALRTGEKGTDGAEPVAEKREESTWRSDRLKRKNALRERKTSEKKNAVENYDWGTNQTGKAESNGIAISG